MIKNYYLIITHTHDFYPHPHPRPTTIHKLLWTGATVWLFCYCRLLISGRTVTRVQSGSVSHFHSVFGQAFSLLSPRPLPAPFDSPHLLLSLGSFNVALSRANCALKENACTAGWEWPGRSVLTNGKRP